jgi:hypothetical protein
MISMVPEMKTMASAPDDLVTRHGGRFLAFCHGEFDACRQWRSQPLPLYHDRRRRPPHRLPMAIAYMRRRLLSLLLVALSEQEALWMRRRERP